MPTVMTQQGAQKFPYTQQGMAAAQQATQISGGQSNFDQDPFAEIVNAARRPSMVGGGMMSGGQQPAGNMPNMQGVAGEEMMPTGMQALQPGKTGDMTKPLLGAIQQLHGFIASATDPEDIQMIRQIVSILTNLIQRDQERSGQEMTDGMGGMNGGMQNG